MDGITDTMNMNLSKLWEMVKDREPWWAAVHRIAKDQTGLSDQQQQAQMSIAFIKQLLSASSSRIQCGLISCLEKAMAPHSSTLVWKIPWMEEPGRLQSMGSLRVGDD